MELSVTLHLPRRRKADKVHVRLKPQEALHTLTHVKGADGDLVEEAPDAISVQPELSVVNNSPFGAFCC